MLALVFMCLLIVLGSVLQVVTGVGLGLIAGPALLFFLDAASAIQVAIVLNLLLSLCLLYPDRKAVSIPWLKTLAGWTLLGLPLGFAMLSLVSQGTLKILAAVFILLALLQIKFFPAKTLRQSGLGWHARMGSTLSGVFVGVLAAPGPVALWTLLSHGVDALIARATLRYYFIVAYSLAFALHWFIAGVGAQLADTLWLLVPAMFAGIAIGLVIRRKVTPGALMQLLEFVLLAMGLSLLIKGVVDVV